MYTRLNVPQRHIPSDALPVTNGKAAVLQNELAQKSRQTASIATCRWSRRMLSFPKLAAKRCGQRCETIGSKSIQMRVCTEQGKVGNQSLLSTREKRAFVAAGFLLDCRRLLLFFFIGRGGA